MPTPTPQRFLLSVVVPCYNEAKTLEQSLDRVRAIEDEALAVQLIVVDDCSSDDSYSIALAYAERYSGVIVHRHGSNAGKGAALNSGFGLATGDCVAVHDADLEYDPRDLRRLVEPIREDRADVVLGSRFLSGHDHRVLYFWHSLGNKFLTLLSNMLTDLNITDMECCYKLFRQDVIRRLDLREKRFGFEPEVVARVATMRLRIYESGVSYHGRTYGEGKKIGAKDGLRALYCILKYNLPCAPWPIQFAFYLLVGVVAAVVDVAGFGALLCMGHPVVLAAPAAFGVAAIVNYLLSVSLLFRHRKGWSGGTEVLAYFSVVVPVAAMDLGITVALINAGLAAVLAKIGAALLCAAVNYAARRNLVFAVERNPDW